MSHDVQIAGAAGPAPQSYEVPNATEVIPRAINATFDGTGAASAFRPTVEIISDGGVVVARIPTDTSVSAGGSAEVSFFPRVRKLIATSSNTYQAVIDILRGSVQLVGEWHLNDGSTPYADTSGFSPGSPATEIRQVRVVAMTQSNPSGPLTSAPSGPSVRFNFDGTAITSSGDYLEGTMAATGSAYTSGSTSFSIVAWVLPGAGANAHDGPVVNTIGVTGFGTPGAHDDGWRLNVTFPGLIPQFQRAANVLFAGTYDTAAGPALSTTGWTMLVGTYDGANIRLYVNGALAATTASAGAVVTAHTTVQIGIGPHQLGDFSTWYFGSAAEITLWGSTLSAANVSALYTAATT